MVIAEYPQPPDNAFLGGAFDGWDRDATETYTCLGGPVITFRSQTNQWFDARYNRAQAASLMIGESSVVDNRGIKAGNTLTIAFPAVFKLSWDIDHLSFGGSATGNVGIAYLGDQGHSIRIPVIADFAAGEQLILNDLWIEGFVYCQHGAGRLLVDFTDDGLWDMADEFVFVTRMVWPGGAYDGWDRDATPEPRRLYRRGSMIKCY